MYSDYSKGPDFIEANTESNRRSTKNGYTTGKKVLNNSVRKLKHDTANNPTKSRRKRSMSVELPLLEDEDSNASVNKERTSYSEPPSPYTGSERQQNNICNAVKTDQNRPSGSDLEDGEISDDGSSVSLSSSEYEKYNLEAISESEEVNERDDTPEMDVSNRKYIAPCVRLIVVGNSHSEKTSAKDNAEKESEDEQKHQSSMKEGTLFIITCMGGSIGREGTQHLVLLDEESGCSKDHASIMFRDEKYYLVDKGSTNGTFFEQ